MKLILKWEELVLFALSIYALYDMHVQWWVYLLLFLGPDTSMLGYAAGNRAGAISYNLFHHKGIAAIVFIAGWLSGIGILQVTGIVLFGHSCMDRVFGYGLKYFTGFKFTHLGEIGKQDSVK
ncbi:DUF4260 domain-containing protein [Agriterribacter sp.]|uniref:DUF4260 domain-containing protein n=1 Tax=Agriterribacter sp. TaxID=2821509 RepID=UPI002C9198B6|nr:DUF4260 domain-containing protein [Agriterribacter sp.]HTN08372.1 DUF4260 domain-containing protein [Agriterribacter sp.]